MGIVHGGLLFSAADVAVGLAAQSLWEGRTVTISANANYLRSGKDTKELLIARVQKSGSLTGFFNAKVYDDSGRSPMIGQYVLHYSP